MPVSKLYVEGKTDLSVLKATLSLLPNNPQIARKGSKDDLHHIVRREREDSPLVSLVYLRDRDFDFEPVCPVPDEPFVILRNDEMHGLRWQRHEIESYLLTPALVEEAFGVPVSETETALLDAASQLRAYQAARWTMGQTRSQSRQISTLQSRPSGVREFQLPPDISASAVEAWLTTSVASSLAGYTSALNPATLQQRFNAYQTKFSSLSAAEVLVWFSPKDLLVAMNAWRTQPKIKAAHAAEYGDLVIRWFEKGNGLRFFNLVPEAAALARILTT